MFKSGPYVSGKTSTFSLDKLFDGKKGKRISLSSSADSGSRTTSRAGSIKRKLFKRNNDNKDKDSKSARYRQRNESVSTGTGELNNFFLIHNYIMHCFGYVGIFL